jgi:hypothetical protein
MPRLAVRSLSRSDNNDNKGNIPETFRLTSNGMTGNSLPRSEGKGYDLVESKGPVIHPVLMRSPQLAFASAGFTPLPNRLRAKLKYVATFSASAGVTPGVNVYSANGLYDPDITGTGHQPRGFDQLIALYDHFVVLKSSCKAEFVGANLPTVVGIQLQSSSTVQSDYIDYAEQARCTYECGNWYQTSGGLMEPKKHELHFDASQFMGIPDPLTATKLQGSVGANPSDQAFFHVFHQALDGSTSVGQSVLVTITYDVVFIEPVPVASS